MSLKTSLFIVFLSMQEALSSLTLQPQEEVEKICSDKVLLGKILATRNFRRFTITKIVEKTRKTNMIIRIEKLEENLFKFTFRNKKDNDQIFKELPWSFNGAHLILKDWATDMGLKEIYFQASTFTLQVHGLLPMYIYEGIARKIGELVGIVHPDSINKRSIVANQFLRLRVIILDEEPIPVGFF